VPSDLGVDFCHLWLSAFFSASPVFTSSELSSYRALPPLIGFRHSARPDFTFDSFEIKVTIQSARTFLKANPRWKGSVAPDII